MVGRARMREARRRKGPERGDRMLGYLKEVAEDLVLAAINPDAASRHPLALRVLCIAWLAVVVAGLAHIYAQDGVIAL